MQLSYIRFQYSIQGCSYILLTTQCIGFWVKHRVCWFYNDIYIFLNFLFVCTTCSSRIRSKLNAPGLLSWTQISKIRRPYAYKYFVWIHDNGMMRCTCYIYMYIVYYNRTALVPYRNLNAISKTSNHFQIL